MTETIETPIEENISLKEKEKEELRDNIINAFKKLDINKLRNKFKK